MVQIDITYQGELRCQATHKPSGTKLLTDAPVDNMGKGESFSPTDLVATALGTCMLTTMGIVANRMNLDISGSSVKVLKDMVSTPMRRVGKLTVELRVPVKTTEEQQQKLRNAALTCPVYLTLHPDVEKPTTFLWAK